MRQLTQDAQAIFQAAVRSVQADRLLADFNIAQYLSRPLDSYQRVVVVGAGKAAMATAGAVEARWKMDLDAGLVVVPRGYRQTLPEYLNAPQDIEVVEAGHPVPDSAGVQATQRVLELVRGCTSEDLLLVLISGGGSALWPAFAPGVSLEAAQTAFLLLLRSGADIQSINTVRKHLSRIGGGRLAEAAYPATVLALLLSDVPGDKASVIASGPTVPDPTTLGEARDVLHDYGLWKQLPLEVRAHLTHGDAETPKPGHSAFTTTRTVLIGSNNTALQAASALARTRGYDVQIRANTVTGEAREVGAQLARQALGTRADSPVCLLQGGETTVHVVGNGRGGRNQEVALAAALELEGTDRAIVILSGGTDGIDGPTDAAGAWATPGTARQARHRGLDPLQHLEDNNSYPFFEAIGDLLKSGPTHTNVMDLQIVLIDST